MGRSNQELGDEFIQSKSSRASRYLSISRRIPDGGRSKRPCPARGEAMHVSDGRVAPRCRTVIGEPNQVMSVCLLAGQGASVVVPGRLSELQQPMAELVPPNRTPSQIDTPESNTAKSMSQRGGSKSHLGLPTSRGKKGTY